MLAPSSSATTRKRRSNSVRQQYEAARQAYVLAVEGPRVEDIAAARAAYQAAQAATALAQRQFDDTRLYAPSDGVVEDRILEPGDMASPATPVLTIALLNPLWVRAYAPENELGRIRLGMKASVTADSYPGRTYEGWIGYISPTAEFTPKTVETPELRTALVYQLRVYVCDAHGELRLGMPATVRIDLTQPARRRRPVAERAMPPPDEGAPALRLEGVRRSFRSGKRVVAAIDGITASAAHGAVTGLIGPDGAGKTTLMRLIAGLLLPDAGTIEALGIDVARDPLAVQARIGYMPQRFGLYEDLSVRQNLDLYADLQGVPAERPPRPLRRAHAHDRARALHRAPGRDSCRAA